AAALACLVHHAVVRVALVHRDCLRLDAASGGGVEKRGDEQGLVAARRLDPPGNRKVGTGAHGGVNLVAVERASGARRNRGAMPPRSIRIGVPLALRAALENVLLAIAESCEVACINGDVLPILRQRVLQRRRNAVKAVSKRGLVLAQLDGEAVARP